MKHSMNKIIKKILLDTLVFITIAILLIVIQVFVFWFMFGEGASSGRIADLWYVNLILEYLPLAVVVGFLAFKTFGRLKKKESDMVKANLITGSMIIILYLSRYQIISLIG